MELSADNDFCCKSDWINEIPHSCRMRKVQEVGVVRLRITVQHWWEFRLLTIATDHSYIARRRLLFGDRP